MANILKKLLLFSLLLSFYSCSIDYSIPKWDKHDKQQFIATSILQVADGLTTISHLDNNENNYISSAWNWKYGEKRPSAEHVWAVKAIELLGLYYIAPKLSPALRNWTYWTIDSTLVGCVGHNISIGAGFKIDY